MSGMARPQSAFTTQEKCSLSPTSPTSFKSSSRPATAGRTSIQSKFSTFGQEKKTSSNDLHRDAQSYFDSFKKDELREFIAQCTASWLLSPDYRGNTGLPCGLVSTLSLSQDPHMTLLFPKEDDVPALEYRELHQIIRELTSGIFGANQMPSLCIVPNFDLSSTCQLPVAYRNTKVGQVLISVDYAVKSLWHGACVARGQRSKLAERWRSMLDVNSATGEFDSGVKNVSSEFDLAGQRFITSDPIYEHVYDELNKVDPSICSAKKENQFCNKYSDYIKCVMMVSLSKVSCLPAENIISFDALYDISSAVTLADDDLIPPVELQRLRRRLRHHMMMIRKGLLLDPKNRRNLALLKFITAVSLILVALRRRLMRVPDIHEFLAPLSGETLHTETELPPFAIGEDGVHPCETFTVNHKGDRRLLTHTHGEIQFDYDTGNVEVLSNQQQLHTVQMDAKKHLLSIRGDRPRLEYEVPTTVLDGKDYYVVRVPLTTYYPVSPPIPAWLHARYQLISAMRPKKLPMNDIQLTELFKKIFGFKKALANKSLDGSLRLCATRGLVAPFIALLRKAASSSLLSPDLQGMTLLHHCCIHNRSSILSLLLNHNPNLNTRRTEINPKSTRATPLIYAARCGALECVTALLASRAHPIISDSAGRSAIHLAAAADHISIVRSLLRRHPNLLEIRATGGDNATPLLVAASNGSLPTIKFLIDQGACTAALDINGDGMVHRAALNFHATVIEYFIGLSQPLTGAGDAEMTTVWNTLIEMLSSKSIIRQDAALRCLEVLLHHNSTYWYPLQAAGAVEPLVNLLKSNKRRPKSSTVTSDTGENVDSHPPIRSLACSVVCLMSEQDSVRRQVAEAGAIPTLISLLRPVRIKRKSELKVHDSRETPNERCELQSRCSVVLSDLAHVNASDIAEHGGIRPLVDLLQLDVVDVLVNAVTTIATLCRGDTSGVGDIQKRVMECGAADYLVDFLRVRDDALQTSTADAIAAICDGNADNQNEFVEKDVLRPLVSILRGHCISAQMKAALAVDCITKDNLDAQHKATAERAPDALCRLFQIWSDNVKERGACALWSLAGCHPEQQRVVSQRIGTKQLIEMLLSSSDTLQLIGCQAVTAIGRNRVSGQNQLADEGTVPSLVRLLRLERTSRNVLAAALEAIKSMCIGVAHVNNKKTQQQIAEEGAIDLLLDRIWQTSRDEYIQVELLLCLACLVTGCPSNEEKLEDCETFDYDILLELLHSVEVSVRFRASLALTLFAFNRLPQQHKMLKVGGIPMKMFESLLNYADPKIRAGAAFQLVVLARVVYDTNIVDASARGIVELVQLLDRNENDVIVAVEGYLASLAHTRAGVSDAMITSGVVSKLFYHLHSQDDQVRKGAAQALGYLSFNRTASRELMTSCRAAEGIYESLISNLDEDGKVSDEFVAEFKRHSTIGLPIPKDRTPPPRRNARPNTACGKPTRLGIIKYCEKTLRPRSTSPASHVTFREIQK